LPTSLGYVLTDPALADTPGVAAARAEFTERCAALLAAARAEPGGETGARFARHLIRGAQGWVFLRQADPLVGRADDLARLLAA
jgi:hypothetical protein